MKPESLTIAFVFAHPDDEAIPFGLPAQLTQDKHIVHLIALTDGSLGSHTIRSRRKVAQMRKKEFADAGEVLGAETHILGFRDGYITSSKKEKHKLLEQMRRINPDIVLIPGNNDYHDDHVQTHEIAKWTAFHLLDSPIMSRRGLFGKTPATHKSISVYEVDTQGSQTWRSAHEDIGESMQHMSDVTMVLQISDSALRRSVLSFSQHKSQLTPRPDGKIGYTELAIRGAIRRGKQAGFSYGTGVSFIPFGGYAFSTDNKLARIFGSSRTKIFSH